MAWHTQQAAIAVLPIGYGDGFRAPARAQALVNGKAHRCGSCAWTGYLLMSPTAAVAPVTFRNLIGPGTPCEELAGAAAYLE